MINGRMREYHVRECALAVKKISDKRDYKMKKDCITIYRFPMDLVIRGRSFNFMKLQLMRMVFSEFFLDIT